jgi:glycosyltransferase involved in cell wall biosynthesis
MTNALPKISIITPCLNREKYIREAIESVKTQNYPELEHIIIDGGSTDQTLKILSGYAHLKVVSGPDQGMYNALNKGLELATGEIIGFLNTDDLYASNIFFDMADAFKDSQVAAIAGDGIVFSDGSHDMKTQKISFSPKDTDLLTLSTIGNPFFNAWFFRKSVFEKIGIFDTRYRIVADREFMLRFALSRQEYSIANKLVYLYRQHAGSMTFELTDQKFERIADEHLMLTEFYLHQENLPKPARALIQQLRTRDAIKMARISLKAKNLRKSYAFFMAGIQSNPRWISEFLQMAAQYIKNRLT